MSIKSKKREIKRYASRNDRPLRVSGPDRGADSSTSECNETAVVRCNQWECFTRYLCKD